MLLTLNNTERGSTDWTVKIQKLKLKWSENNFIQFLTTYSKHRRTTLRVTTVTRWNQQGDSQSTKAVNWYQTQCDSCFHPCSKLWFAPFKVGLIHSVVLSYLAPCVERFNRRSLRQEVRWSIRGVCAWKCETVWIQLKETLRILI